LRPYQRAVAYGSAVLSLEIRAVEGCTVLELAGDFDSAGAPRVRETLTHLVDATAGPIVVDLGGISSIDNDALGVLIGADHRLQKRGDRLRIARPRSEVLGVVQAAGVDRVLRIYDTREEACARES
jgi:anti-anti-sigma factor